MRVDVLTIFPGLFSGFLSESMVRIAREKGLLEVRLHDFRAFAKGPRKPVDDKPFGGGPGMVLARPLSPGVRGAWRRLGGRPWARAVSFSLGHPLTVWLVAVATLWAWHAPAAYDLLGGHGILRERFADVLTDALRAAILRQQGYRVEVVEFVASEHTPRNTMLRAVRTGAAPDPGVAAEYDALTQAWGVHPKLAALLR